MILAQVLKMELKNLTLMNNLNLQKFLPDINEEIEITDHLLDINLVDENLSIKGKGNLLLQDIMIFFARM